MIRYILVELVICCESDEKSTANEKMKKLVNFLNYLVDGARVVDVELIDQEFVNVCQGKISFLWLIHGLINVRR
jgi:hypothetical protein